MRVVVTGLRPADLARRLEALGHDVVVCPLIGIEPLSDEPIDPRAYDWVVVTSATGASELARRLVAAPRHIAAIGPGTADALRAHRLEPTLVARTSTQEGLLAELPRPAGRVLFAAAAGARRLILDELDADFLPLYRTRELVPKERPDGDIVVLASASAARAWARLGLDLPAVSIGPQTTSAARDAGVDVVAEADPHDLDGLVEALRRLG